MLHDNHLGANTFSQHVAQLKDVHFLGNVEDHIPCVQLERIFVHYHFMSYLSANHQLSSNLTFPNSLTLASMTFDFWKINFSHYNTFSIHNISSFPVYVQVLHLCHIGHKCRQCILTESFELFVISTLHYPLCSHCTLASWEVKHSKNLVISLLVGSNLSIIFIQRWI